MGAKGVYKTHCDKCGTERKLLSNGRRICPECQRQASKESYHKNKKPLTDEQKLKKKESNLKWKNTIRDSGLTNQQVTKLKSLYNISEEEIISFKLKQDNKCAICKNELINEFLVDHCHNTLQVRGLLCRNCNLAIGMFKDDIDILNNAIKYLKNENIPKTN